MRQVGHFIGGKHVAGTSGRSADIYQPMDGTVIGKVALASAAELRAAGHTVDVFAADGRDDAQVLALVDHALATLGQIDILVNNAGATWGAPAEEHPMDAWDKVMDLNARSVFLLTREVVRRCMLPRGEGRIVNIASVA
eukprot:gene60498-80681_t